MTVVDKWLETFNMETVIPEGLLKTFTFLLTMLNVAREKMGKTPIKLELDNAKLLEEFKQELRSRYTDQQLQEHIDTANRLTSIVAEMHKVQTAPIKRIITDMLKQKQEEAPTQEEKELWESMISDLD